MPSTLLTTKLHRPRPTPNLVARPRLTRQLDEGLRSGHRLFLVVAPAGYGKTPLVTDWVGKAGLPSAWLSLDEADNDPLRFFTYVVAALETALGPSLAQPMLQSFPTAPQQPEAFVRTLIHDLATVNRPILLALDDYHLITAGPFQEAMVFLIEHAPATLHLVLLTRADPPSPTTRAPARSASRPTARKSSSSGRPTYSSIRRAACGSPTAMARAPRAGSRTMPAALPGVGSLRAPRPPSTYRRWCVTGRGQAHCQRSCAHRPAQRRLPRKPQQFAKE